MTAETTEVFNRLLQPGYYLRKRAMGEGLGWVWLLYMGNQLLVGKYEQKEVTPLVKRGLLKLMPFGKSMGKAVLDRQAVRALDGRNGFKKLYKQHLKTRKNKKDDRCKIGGGE